MTERFPSLSINIIQKHPSELAAGAVNVEPAFGTVRTRGGYERLRVRLRVCCSVVAGKKHPAPTALLGAKAGLMVAYTPVGSVI